MTRYFTSIRAITAELSGSWTASAAGITVDYESRRRGSPICALARKLIEAGHDPATELHVYRGATLCFNPVPLGKWAGLTVEEGSGTRFRKFSPSAAQKAAPDPREAPFSGHLDISGIRAPRNRAGPPRGAARVE